MPKKNKNKLQQKRFNELNARLKNYGNKAEKYLTEKNESLFLTCIDEMKRTLKLMRIERKKLD